MNELQQKLARRRNLNGEGEVNAASAYVPQSMLK